MRSSDETIKRFLKADGAVRPAEWLDDAGCVTRQNLAVEARLTRPLGAGLITIRVEVERLQELRL